MGDMTFDGEIDGYKVNVYCHADSVTFTCEAFGYKEFASIGDVEKAVKAYALKLRKNFTNKTAYMIGQWRDSDKVSEVTVTSIDGDQAWVSSADGRSRRNIASLFAKREEVEQAVKFEKESNQAVKAKWDTVTRWQPLTAPRPDAGG